MTTAIEKVGNVAIDQEAILKALNLNPRDPKTQALLVVCERYQLDPLLKHMVLISGNPYITRDGYLAVAHRSGQFDGMEVLATSEDNVYWSAKVAVWRKDMSHPFTYEGRYPKSGHQKQHGPEMAIKCAEVMGLRRAFNVVGVGAADEMWDQQVVDARPEGRVADAPARKDGDAVGAVVAAGPGDASSATHELPPHTVDFDDGDTVRQVNTQTGEVVDVTTQSPANGARTFPPPTPKAAPFNEDDATLAAPPDVMDLMRAYARLDVEQKEAYNAAIAAAELLWPKSPKGVAKADHARLVELLPKDEA